MGQTILVVDDAENLRTLVKNYLLEHSVLAYVPQAQQQQVELHLDIEDKLPEIWVDPDRIVQVLNNPISHALRHTPAGGIIHLAAVRSQDAVAFKIQDSGGGIAEEDLPHINGLFVRHHCLSGDELNLDLQSKHVAN